VKTSSATGSRIRPAPAQFTKQSGAATPLGLAGMLLVLVVAWILWSGYLKPLLLGLGAFSCLLTLFLAYRMGFFARAAELPGLLPRLPGYWLWLITEIVKSSYNVARIVLSPSLPISPTVARIKADPHGEISQVILANSITLSPGSITIDIHDEELLVHCITRRNADDVIEGEGNRRAGQLERHP